MLTTSEVISALHGLRGTGTWRQLATQAGCDYGTLSRIARGTQMPRGDLLERLSAAIDGRATATDKAQG